MKAFFTGFWRLTFVPCALCLAFAGCDPASSPKSDEKPAYAVAIAPLSNGTITSDKITATEGETVTLTVTPCAEYQLQAGTLTATKTGDSATVVPLSGSASLYTFTMPAHAITVSAGFVLPIAMSAANGSIIASVEGAAVTGSAAGETVTLTVTENAGYQLKPGTVTVTKVGDSATTVSLSGSAPSYTFTMPEYGVTVSAEFEAKSYSVTVAALANGSITVASSAKTDSSVTVAVTANAGYQLKPGTVKVAKTGDGATSVSLPGSASSYTFTMPAYGVTVSAEFVKLYALGDIGPAGGRIFYVASDYSLGWRYMEIAPRNASDSARFYSARWLYADTGFEVGTGFDGTNYICSQIGTTGPYAAQLCYNAEIGGYDDWFLPATMELFLVYSNFSEGIRTSIGVASGVFWASRVRSGSPEVVDMANSTSYGITNPEFTYCAVRPIRRF